MKTKEFLVYISKEDIPNIGTRQFIVGLYLGTESLNQYKTFHSTTMIQYDIPVDKYDQTVKLIKSIASEIQDTIDNL